MLLRVLCSVALGCLMAADQIDRLTMRETDQKGPFVQDLVEYSGPLSDLLEDFLNSVIGEIFVPREIDQEGIERIAMPIIDFLKSFFAVHSLLK